MENQKMRFNSGQISPVNSSLFFKMMFQNAEHTSILVMDLNGNILDANYGLQQSFGYSRDFLIGKNFSILFIEEDKKRGLPEYELKKAIETGSATDDNYLVQKDGAATWVHGESIYAKDDQGREFVVKVIQDINEEKLLGMELKKKAEEQERVINDKDIFIYAASHDLQSPINNIEGLVNILKEKNSDPEEFDLLISMIEKSIVRFRNKIAELSELGEEQEKAKRESEGLDFQQTLDDILLDLEDEIISSQAEIVSDFSKAPTINFPKKNMKSILQNLVSNTIKYRSPDRTPKVKVGTDNINGEYVLLKVEDNGLGIKEEDKDRVFRMYQRLHHHQSGTGVGMAIVKRIVDNAGGKIELESKIGNGSTFKIYLPV